jgi:hypothetical protein
LCSPPPLAVCLLLVRRMCICFAVVSHLKLKLTPGLKKLGWHCTGAQLCGDWNQGFGTCS